MAAATDQRNRFSRQLYKTQAFQHGLRGRETNREMGITVGWAGSNGYTEWGINRWNTDFSDREVELASHIQPVLRLLKIACGNALDGLDRASAAERYSLTTRELETMQLLAKDLAVVAIGHLLGISPRNVEKHLEHTYAKLGCTNRIDALQLPAREPRLTADAFACLYG